MLFPIAANTIITLLVNILFVCVICWAIIRLMATWGVPEQVQGTVYIILVVLVVAWLATVIVPFILPIRIVKTR